MAALEGSSNKSPLRTPLLAAAPPAATITAAGSGRSSSNTRGRPSTSPHSTVSSRACRSRSPPPAAAHRYTITAGSALPTGEAPTSTVTHGRSGQAGGARAATPPSWVDSRRAASVPRTRIEGAAPVHAAPASAASFKTREAAAAALVAAAPCGGGCLGAKGLGGEKEGGGGVCGRAAELEAQLEAWATDYDALSGAVAKAGVEAARKDAEISWLEGVCVCVHESDLV